MAGVAGTNVDKAGFIFDPVLDDVKQHYKELGAQPLFGTALRSAVGGFRTVKIPTAQMLALNTTPVQIVPAPGSGLLIVPSLMVATLVFNSAAYSTNSSGASLKYGTAGAGTSVGMTLTQGFLQSSSGTNIQVVQASTTAYSPSNSSDVNAPLTLIAATSDPTTGDSDLYVRVYFQIVAVPFP